MTTWLHRISWCAELSRPLLEKGYLSIGFSEFAAISIDEVRGRRGQAYLDKEFKEKWGGTPRSRFSLLMFLRDMKEGDRVLVPAPGSFSLYELTEHPPLSVADAGLQVPEITASGGQRFVHRDGLFRRADSNGSPAAESGGIDLGFLRRVKCVSAEPIPRGCCDSRLASRMKIRVTTADISDLSRSVDEAVARFRDNKPFNLGGRIKEQASTQVLGLLREEIKPEELERLVQSYLRRCGATEAEIPAKNSSGKQGDADVVATFESIRTVIYVQVKHHQGNTDEWAVEQITEFGKGKGGADGAYTTALWVVSTGDGFTQKCKDLAEENGVLLIGGREFAEMLLDVGLGGLEA
jgi:predicted Mrr-cat superfamily restriction endonuclease